MDKEDVVHTHSGISLNHEKEQNCIIYRDMRGPRDHHTEWSESEKQMYNVAPMWNLDKLRR